MSYVIVQIRFEDFDKWMKVFEEAADLRKSYGSMGVRVFRNTAQANEVFILGEYESHDKARQMFQSQEFREAIKQAGVSGPPVVTYLDEARQLPA